MSHKPRTLPTALALAALATGAAVLVAMYAETRMLSLLVLVLEPFLWFGLGAGCLYALVERRWHLAAVGAWSLAVLVFALRQPAPVVGPPAFAPDAASPVVRNCASLATTPSAPVRVLTWNVGGSDDELAADIVQSEADLIVLQEVTAERVAEVTAAVQERLVTDFARARLAHFEELGEVPPAMTADQADLLPVAEGLHVPTMGNEGLGLIVRNGEFSYCGDADRFPIPLPAAGDRVARGALVFASLERPDAERGYDLVPLMGVHLDRPGGPGELSGWPQRLKDSAETIAGFARALDTPNLVIAGDTNTHGTFRGFPGSMKGAGLTAVPPRASWPASLMGVPALPLYQLDRVWHGDAWVTSAVRTLRGPGDHLGILATLSPREVATADLMLPAPPVRLVD